jgi:hypothetical protein
MSRCSERRIWSGAGGAGLDRDLDEVAGFEQGVRVGGVGDRDGVADAVEDRVGVGLRGVGAVAHGAAGAVGAGGDFDLPVPLAVAA